VLHDRAVCTANRIGVWKWNAFDAFIGGRSLCLIAAEQISGLTIRITTNDVKV